MYDAALYLKKKHFLTVAMCVWKREEIQFTQNHSRLMIFILLAYIRKRGRKKNFFLCFTYVQIYSLLHFDVKLQNYFLKYYSCALNRASECIAVTSMSQALSTRDQLNLVADEWVKRESWN